MRETVAYLSVQDFVQYAINLLRSLKGRAGSIFRNLSSILLLFFLPGKEDSVFVRNVRGKFLPHKTRLVLRGQYSSSSLYPKLPCWLGLMKGT